MESNELSKETSDLIDKCRNEEKKLREKAEEHQASIIAGYLTFVSPGWEEEFSKRYTEIHKSGFNLIVQMKFDLLSAKTDDFLHNGFCPGFVKADIQRQTAGSLIYRLSQDTLGEQGTIEIQKMDENNSKIMVRGVPLIFAPLERTETNQVTLLKNLEVNKKEIRGPKRNSKPWYYHRFIWYKIRGWVESGVKAPAIKAKLLFPPHNIKKIAVKTINKIVNEGLSGLFEDTNRG